MLVMVFKMICFRTNLDGVVLVEDRRGRTSEMVNPINLDQQRLRDIYISTAPKKPNRHDHVGSCLTLEKKKKKR